jgi:hypothetical protein
VKVESYQSAETYFVTGRSLSEARDSMSRSDTPLEAWEEISYFDREGYPEEFEVFRFEVVEKITKVDPPYTREPK